MSLVTFAPVEGCPILNGWPENLLGDGFIRLKLWGVFGLDKSESEGGHAIYRDQFKDEYELEDCNAGEWEVEVRED